MRTYTIEIYKETLSALEAATVQCPGTEIKVIGETDANGIAKYRVQVTAQKEQDLFYLGFWTERIGDQKQQEHYDLRDSSKLEVEVPAAFLLVCKFFKVDPAGTLALFAGDLSQHPFNTGGSDERSMAKEYFLRGHYAGDNEDKAEALFEELYILRRSWPGNNKMEEYKKTYTETLQELDKQFNQKG